ncbi:sce7725 family protein [Plastoroseomonas hellenica]|uniref:sce7725 family protein n=1 Tax=Plastoroseomonas hellenica TaxID=2687306 RepID=UPI001BABDB40|nr:sce7725 family protein [Plastoroseomonas hellenica]MBR0644146.1 sce7725 family protein [Plastoroseomonas hellenica]
MYHPYFRGKQFELITIRETATLLATKNFVPIIEPVREALGGLERTLKAICDAGGKAIVIVNPYHGDHRESGVGISALLKNGFIGNDTISAGILLRSDMALHEATACYDAHKKHNPTIVHAGFTSPRALAEHLDGSLVGSRHLFVDDYAKILYRKHFEASTRILVRDGFNRQRNADYPPLEEFSDLHVTYGDMGMAGFGDFLIVGDSYSESGGPAYAVAIHLTFIDPDKDDVMYIYHFVSDTKDTPTDPAGKFAQALRKLIRRLESGKSKLLETSAIKEFRALHAKGHFPGLGYVKKLSMKHHIETLAGYLS